MGERTRTSVEKAALASRIIGKSYAVPHQMPIPGPIPRGTYCIQAVLYLTVIHAPAWGVLPCTCFDSPPVGKSKRPVMGIYAKLNTHLASPSSVRVASPVGFSPTIHTGTTLKVVMMSVRPVHPVVVRTEIPQLRAASPDPSVYRNSPTPVRI